MQNWRWAALRTEAIMQTEPRCPDPEEINEVRQRYDRLLFREIPKFWACFPSLDMRIVETTNHVDRFRLVRPMSSRGFVVKAADEFDRPFVIKTYVKKNVHLQQLESIYREYRFTRQILRHPCIARCRDILHTQHRLHLIFDFAGDHNLCELVRRSPGQRLNEKMALRCFRQIVSGVAFMHESMVAHRKIDIENVAIEPTRNGEEYTCKLVDLSCAIYTRPNTLCRRAYGNFPEMAPEMRTVGQYRPLPADCWSVGCVLLLASASINSMEAIAGYDPMGDNETLMARQIAQAFSQPGIADILQHHVGSPVICDILTRLLRVQPNTRLTMQEQHFL
jgi:serine/threonine protein kinase